MMMIEEYTNEWCVVQLPTTCWPVPSHCPRRVNSPIQIPQFYCSAWHHVVWHIPLANVGQLSWLCPLPAPCAPLAHHCQGNARSWKLLDLIRTKPKHWCVINIILILNPEHRTIPLTLHQPKPGQTWRNGYQSPLVLILLLLYSREAPPPCKAEFPTFNMRANLWS